MDIGKDLQNAFDDGYNKAIDDVIKLVDDDLTFDIGMDMYVERDLLCEKLEKLRI